MKFVYWICLAIMALQVGCAGQYRDVQVNPNSVHTILYDFQAPQSTHPAAINTDDPLQEWRRWDVILREPDPEQREDLLRELYSDAQSAYLRALIIQTIAQDPVYQSRQARFIRKYGFYANGINRIVYSGEQLLQGQIQAIGELVVDSVFFLTRPSEANPNDRRAMALSQRAELLTPESTLIMTPREKEKLIRAVEYAHAVEDLDRAYDALLDDNWRAADFYANKALEIRPGWNKAEKVAYRADELAVKKRRDAAASVQVGYPDRPFISGASPDFLRWVLAATPSMLNTTTDSTFLNNEQRFFLQMLTASANHPVQDQTGVMQTWKGLDKITSKQIHVPEWVEATVDSPRHNPKQRLQLAQENRRSQLWRYVFLGPETAREQAYKASMISTNAFTMAYDVMDQLGLFYGFELIMRSVQLPWVQPPPSPELMDAQVAWLRDLPDLNEGEAKDVIESVVKQMLKDRRYEDARQMLKPAGLLDSGRAAKIDKKEKKYKKLVERSKKKKAPKETFLVSWNSLQNWMGTALPCGLSGETRSFVSGQPAKDDFQIQWREGESEFQIKYQINDSGKVHKVEETRTLDQLPLRTRQWFELVTSQRSKAEHVIRDMKRTPIPFEIGGGIGMSGVDVQPKLLPIEGDAEEMLLYE